MRAYCRRCDTAVDAVGAWPGRCRTCRAPIEAAPVPDIVAPGLRVLFVGINPGVQTARARLHFANPQNAFWRALHASGLAPPDVGPADRARLLAAGVGITNVVSRATPGSADVTREDVLRGRERLEALVRDVRPAWLAFVGKQAYTMATGVASPPLGEAPPLWGARVFVLPSTSPANAAIPPQEKIAWLGKLAHVVLQS